MSDALPTVLYKYLALQYAQRLIDNGELMSSTLSWFQRLEDQQRGDLLEGTHVHRPEAGLEVTMVHRAGDPGVAGQRRTLGPESLVSQVIGQDHIFIYSTSLRAGLNQFSTGNDETVCVEIHSPAKFFGRLKAGLHKWPPIAKTPVIHNRVSYYATTDLPGTTYALPDRIIFHKHETFRDQHEYRFAFGTQSNVFDFERVQWSLREVGDTARSRELNDSEHRLQIRLGSLSDCCRLI